MRLQGEFGFAEFAIDFEIGFDDAAFFAAG